MGDEHDRSGVRPAEPVTWTPGLLLFRMMRHALGTAQISISSSSLSSARAFSDGWMDSKPGGSDAIRGDIV